MISVVLLCARLVISVDSWYSTVVQYPSSHHEPAVCVLCCCRLAAGLVKRYGLDVTDAEILQANLDGQDLPVSVVAEAAELNK